MTSARAGDTARLSDTGASDDRLEVERIQSLERLGEIRHEWIALAESLASELPFNRFEWMAAWWRNLRRDTTWTRDSLSVYTFRRQGELVAVAPFMVTSRRVAGVPLLRVLQPIGTDPNITELRCLLVRPADADQVVCALIEQITATHSHSVVIAGLSVEADTRLRLVPGIDITDGPSMFVVDLPPSWDELRAQLPRNTREALRKCKNSLTRDGHVPNFPVYESADDILDRLPRFFELHRARAAATDTVHHRDVFQRPSEQQFLADLITYLAPEGRIRLFAMEIAGTIVAMRMAIRSGDCLYLYYSGYDLAWAKYSVMTSVTSVAIQHAISTGLKRVNLSTGADQSKLRWRPREVPTRTVAVHRLTLPAKVLARAIDIGKSLRPHIDRMRRTAKADTEVAEDVTRAQ
jgi:CelD/BcsL family acetyltransferase involved in cellulose biosynthesis